MKSLKLLLIIFPILLVALVVGVTVNSCGNNRSPLAKAIKADLINGDTTQQQFDSICNIIKDNPDQYKEYVSSDGEINVEALNKFVNEIGSRMRPPMHWDLTSYGMHDLSLTVYFERSGSMVPYDSRSGGGQLKRAVNDLISAFPSTDSKDVSIKIVNSEIMDYGKSVDNFIKDRDIYASTQGMGDAKYTDFQLIFESILKQQDKDKNNVSVLVTDMIYSPENTEDVSTSKIFNEENAQAKMIFKRYNGKSVIVKKMMGDFDGMYYPYNNEPFKYCGQRPFYIIVIADSRIIDRMAATDKYTRFLDQCNSGTSYRFNQEASTVDFNIIPGWKTNCGKFRNSHDDPSELNNCEGDRNTGIFSFAVAVDLSKLQKSADFFENANYNVTSLNKFQVSVNRIDFSSIDNNTMEFVKGKTHIITITGKLNTPKDKIEISLPNVYPSWIKDSNTDDDTNPNWNGFSTSTFGLDHFLSGIFDAFTSNGGSSYFSLSIKLNK